MKGKDTEVPEHRRGRARICWLVFLCVTLGVPGILFAALTNDMPLWVVSLAVPAVVTGHLALWRIGSSSGALTGRNIAVRALTVGYVQLVFCAADVSLAEYRALRSRRDVAVQRTCADNLKVIGRACRAYASEHDGLLPDRLSHLYPDYIPTLDVFVCPSTGDRITSTERIQEEGSYVYVGSGLKWGDPFTPVAFQRKHPHSGYNVLYACRHVPR